MDETPVVGAGDGEGHDAGMSWGKKRKRKEKDTKAVRGAKLRRSSTAEEAASKVADLAKGSIGAEIGDPAMRTVDEHVEPDATAPGTHTATAGTTLQSKALLQQASAASPATTSQQKPPPSKPNLSLVGYGSSDSESD